MKFAFYKGKGSFLDGVIRFWMRGKYSHCEAILWEFYDGTYLCASSVPGTGVRVARIELPANVWDIVEGPGDPEAAADYANKRVGASYDYIGLFGFIIRPATGDNRGKWWCSEFCLDMIGFPDAWRYDPNAMYDVISYWGKSRAS